MLINIVNTMVLKKNKFDGRFQKYSIVFEL